MAFYFCDVFGEANNLWENINGNDSCQFALMRKKIKAERRQVVSTEMSGLNFDLF